LCAGLNGHCVASERHVATSKWRAEVTVFNDAHTEVANYDLLVCHDTLHTIFLISWHVFGKRVSTSSWLNQIVPFLASFGYFNVTV
jgi:hypothetical protein